MAQHSYSQQQLLSVDKQMLLLLMLHIPVVGFLIPYGYGTTGFALVASLLVGGVAYLGYISLKGTRACSVLFAACIMLFSAIMIQAQMGRIEMHFHIFGALALLIVYRDWLPVLVAAGVIAAHHLLLTALQLSGVELGDTPVMIFNYGCSWSVTFLHAAFVVFESSILVVFAKQMGAERDQAFQVIELVDQFRNEKDISGRVTGGNAAGASFNHLMEQFSELVGQVRALSGHLHTNSQELIEVSEYTRRISAEQQIQMDSAANATQQMAASTHEVAENAQHASVSANQAVEAAAKGSASVRLSISKTETTDQALQSAITQVNDLVVKVTSISDITGSISAISDQTNLLALNAAIESARAGEHGRGFAVVADEVRTLSRRTQEFTLDIRNTADQLTEISGLVLEAIQQGQARSQETLNVIKSAGEEIKHIEAAITDVKQMNMQIAAASEEQSSASSEIHNNVQAVAHAGQGLIEGAQKARTMSELLDEKICQVDTLISGYRT